jgi:hypothetical protein
MKRLIPLLLIGIIVFVLAFACGTSEKAEEHPEEGDSIEVGTLKTTEGDDSVPDTQTEKAIEQDTLQHQKEPLPQDQ